MENLSVRSEPTHITLAVVVGAVVSKVPPFVPTRTHENDKQHSQRPKFSRLRRHVRWVLKNFGACGGPLRAK